MAGDEKQVSGGLGPLGTLPGLGMLGAGMGGGGATTYAELLRRKQIAAALAARQKKFPSTLGEGLTYFGESVGEAIGDWRIQQMEREQAARDARSLANARPVPGYTPPGQQGSKPDVPATGGAPPWKHDPSVRAWPPTTDTPPPAPPPAVPPTSTGVGPVADAGSVDSPIVADAGDGGFDFSLAGMPKLAGEVPTPDTPEPPQPGNLTPAEQTPPAPTSNVAPPAQAPSVGNLEQPPPAQAAPPAAPPALPPGLAGTNPNDPSMMIQAVRARRNEIPAESLPMPPASPDDPATRPLASRTLIGASRGTVADVPRGIENLHPAARSYAELAAKDFPGIKFRSGYRDPQTNADVGGAKGSQHIQRKALDVEVPPDQQDAFIRHAYANGGRGFGHYGGNTIHVDFRDGPVAAWGPNYSKTSLPQTPAFFQRAVAEFQGGRAPAPAAPQYAEVRSGAGGMSVDPNAPARPAAATSSTTAAAGPAGGAVSLHSGTHPDMATLQNKSIPAGERFNNPFNMWHDAYANAHGGIPGIKITEHDTPAVYANKEAGAAAAIQKMAQSPMYSGKTMQDMIGTWVGHGQSYAPIIEQRTGISRNTPITPAFLASDDGLKFLKEMARYETDSSKPYSLTDEQWNRARQVALSNPPTRPDSIAPKGGTQIAQAAPQGPTFAPGSEPKDLRNTITATMMQNGTQAPQAGPPPGQVASAPAQPQESRGRIASVMAGLPSRPGAGAPTAALGGAPGLGVPNPAGVVSPIDIPPEDPTAAQPRPQPAPQLGPQTAQLQNAPGWFNPNVGPAPNVAAPAGPTPNSGIQKAPTDEVIPGQTTPDFTPKLKLGPEPTPERPGRDELFAISESNSRYLSDDAKKVWASRAQEYKEQRELGNSRRYEEWKHQRGLVDDEAKKIDERKYAEPKRYIDELNARHQILTQRLAIAKGPKEMEKLQQDIDKNAQELLKIKQEVGSGKSGAPATLQQGGKTYIWNQGKQDYVPFEPKTAGDDPDPRPEVTMSVEEGKVYNNHARANLALKQYNRFPDADKILSEGIEDEILGKIPFGGNKLMSDKYRVIYNIANNYLQGTQRVTSGAVIGPQEMKDAFRDVIPIAGDDKLTMANKREQRQNMLDATAVATGQGRKLIEYEDRKYKEREAKQQAEISNEMKSLFEQRGKPPEPGEVFAAPGQKTRVWTGTHWLEY